MKHVDIQDIATTAAPVMLRMTQREKLYRWAELIRHMSHEVLIYHKLEHWHPDNLADPHFGNPRDAFTVALHDPVLQAEGLTGNSIADVQKFMGLTQAELHEFSCDCGGYLDNDEVARRIEQLAG